MMDCVLIVRSRQQAFALESYLSKGGIRTAIASTPGGLGQGCSLALWFYKKDIAKVKAAVKTLRISILGVYKRDNFGRWSKLSL